MPRTMKLLGNQELAELLGVTVMDVKNWRRREKLPEPAAVLAYGPVWTPDQFPVKLRRELLAGRDRPTKSTTSPRSGKTRRTSPASKARSRTPRKRG